jgi:hypothetical protein
MVCKVTYFHSYAMEISLIKVSCVDQHDLTINCVLLLTYSCSSLTYKYSSIPHSRKRTLSQITQENISRSLQKFKNPSTALITQNVFPNPIANRADLPTPTARAHRVRGVSQPQHHLNNYRPRPRLLRLDQRKGECQDPACRSHPRLAR